MEQNENKNVETAETETSLTNFLKRKGFDDTQLEFAMEKLNRRGYLSDKSYASSYVNNKIAFSTWGKDKIRRELRQKGVSEDICDKALESFNSNMEEDKIKKRAEKRILANHSKSNLMLKKIIKTDLVSEGFSSALVDKVLDTISFLNEREIEEKTYNKLLSNYIRNSSILNRQLRVAADLLEEWYETVKNKERERLVYCHGKCELAHFLPIDDGYFISLEQAHLGRVSDDIENLFRKNFSSIDLVTTYNLYQRKYPYTLDEKLFLFVKLAIPPKIDIYPCNLETNKRLLDFYEQLIDFNKFILEEQEKEKKSK